MSKEGDRLAAARRKAQLTYDAAADRYDAPPLGFWARYGQRTVERLSLQRGARVLDAPCGSGASALPAAEAVGPDGSVIAADLAGRLLALGRSKARARGLANVEFRQGDMTSLGFADGHFDAVVCVFGIFFVPDMAAQIAEFRRMLRTGGKLAVTTWGPRIFAPAGEIWNETVRTIRPDLVSDFSPWDRITTPDAVRQLCHDAGLLDVHAEPEAGFQILERPEDFWTIVLGSGYRWTIEQLGPEASAEVRRRLCARLAEARVDRVETNVIYAVAMKS